MVQHLLTCVMQTERDTINEVSRAYLAFVMWVPGSFGHTHPPGRFGFVLRLNRLVAMRACFTHGLGYVDDLHTGLLV